MYSHIREAGGLAPLAAAGAVVIGVLSWKLNSALKETSKMNDEVENVNKKLHKEMAVGLKALKA
jgi:hypothetical protein